MRSPAATRSCTSPLIISNSPSRTYTIWWVSWLCSGVALPGSISTLVMLTLANLSLVS